MQARNLRRQACPLCPTQLASACVLERKLFYQQVIALSCLSNKTSKLTFYLGSFQSPQLLELSGIGNSTILKQYGITPLVDLPGVGENLQDHGFLATSYELKPGKTTLDILRNNATFAAEARAQ